jgi:hypothetical protein
VSSQLHAPAALPTGTVPPVPIRQDAGWAPRQVCNTRRRENNWPSRDSNSDPSVVQPVASRYTDYTIPVLDMEGSCEYIEEEEGEDKTITVTLSSPYTYLSDTDNKLILITYVHLKGETYRVEGHLVHCHNCCRLGSQWANRTVYSWLKHYATSRKVAGSIPDEIIRFFNRPNPSSRIMVLGSTSL